MTYQQAVDFLDSFCNYEKIQGYNYSDFSLDRIKWLLEELGNPQERFSSIHIAGTKGKGSTCSFLFHILKEAGYKVALYSSPHLVCFRERMRTASGLIGEDEFASTVEELIPLVKSIKDDKGRSLTYFEVLTAVAFLYFAKSKTDIAILETGLGGRLDATNVVRPLICGITPISYDHTDILGYEITKIATEKIAIIKENIPVASAPQQEEVMNLIKQRCKETNSKLFEVGRQILCETVSQTLDMQSFNIKAIYGEYPLLKTHLLGKFQIINCAVAVSIAELLMYYGYTVTSKDIRQGVLNTQWPGRFQIVERNPFVILDGAQNRASATALRQTLEEMLKDRRIFLILGILSDKDIVGIGKTLCPIADSVIFTAPANPRAQDARSLQEKIGRYCKRHSVANDVEEALSLARKNAKEEDVILITGSLYLVGEVLKGLKCTASV